MNDTCTIPETAYGILYQEKFSCALDEAADQIKRLGYAVIDSGYSAEFIEKISVAFDQTRNQYVEKWGAEYLASLNEQYTIRALLTHDDPIFMQLSLNERLIALLQKLIEGKFILNQQNGVINPGGKSYNQGAWHRDLPYQHFVSNTPLAVNALFCLDHFTSENGSTFVLPASHKSGAFPSQSYIRHNAVQIKALAGQYIMLDCMLFHSGGFNQTSHERRAINHVYTIPYFKQQINLPANLHRETLPAEAQGILGFDYPEPKSIAEYLSSRKK